MAELRWNPMIKDWVMIASDRQNRAINLTSNDCLFCPGGRDGKIPDHYDLFYFENDTPALKQNPSEPELPVTQSGGDIYTVAPAYGKCEVILYSDDHNASFCDLSEEHIAKLVNLWTDRFIELEKDERIKYVYIFENRGETVGVSIIHPHGQIYGYSVIPKKIEIELESCEEYYSEHKKCLFCRMTEEEVDFGKRIIYENESFIAYIPFFADYAYGVYIVPKRHILYIKDLNGTEKTDYADILKKITGAYDSLFDTKFPYMLCMHNAPVNTHKTDLDKFYHFHVEIYPPMRSVDKQQYQASSETGVWAHCNPTRPEDKAQDLRDALVKFTEKQTKDGSK
jgi:UDPglucose--hexose-1-phosphate uridylyltransferase